MKVPWEALRNYIYVYIVTILWLKVRVNKARKWSDVWNTQITGYMVMWRKKREKKIKEREKKLYRVLTRDKDMSKVQSQSSSKSATHTPLLLPSSSSVISSQNEREEEKKATYIHLLYRIAHTDSRECLEWHHKNSWYAVSYFVYIYV